MKVLWITAKFPPNFGGVQKYAYNTILNANNYTETVVLSFYDRLPYPNEYDINLTKRGIKFYQMVSFSNINNVTCFLKQPWSSLRCYWFILKIVLREKPTDIIFFHRNFIFLYSILAIRILSSAKIFLIFHGEDIPIINLKSNCILRFLIKFATGWICNSHFTESRLINFMGERRKIIIAYPGVEEKFFFQENISKLKSKLAIDGKKIIYTVARLDKRKGHDTVLDALKIVSREFPDVIYLIAGNGENLSQLQHKVNQLELKDYVKFCGEIDDNEIVAFHQVGDIFVMPNRALDDGDTEGFGIVFLEANACEKPVIGGRAGGVCEAIEDGVSGILVDPFNVDELAMKICCLLRDKMKARTIGLAGRRRANEMFHWSILVGNLINNLELFDDSN